MKLRPKKLKSTSVDSKLFREQRFQMSLQDAINSHETILNIGKLQYTAEYKTCSTFSHSRITYKVIHRNTGCSLLIKLTRVLNISSQLRKHQKFNRNSKRIAIKWMPRLKVRY